MLFADHNSTTPLAEPVFSAMEPFLREYWENPSNPFHPHNALIKRAIARARECVAALLSAHPDEIIFTAGGTESCFLGLVGCFSVPATIARTRVRDHLLISAVEHKAVMTCARFLQDFDPAIEVEIVPVSDAGQIDQSALMKLVRPGRSVVSLMLANNETGVLSPLADIARALRELDVVIHTDAVQALGKIEVNCSALGVDLLSGSAHKFHGPKGVGILFVRRGLSNWRSPMIGGGQESGRRGGTENVAGIVGCGAAAELAFRPNTPSAVNKRLERMLQSFAREYAIKIAINGAESPRLANTTSLTIDGVLGEDLVAELAERQIIVSTGSACSISQSQSSHGLPSHVLLAMGLDILAAASTIRISPAMDVSDTQLEMLAAEIIKSAHELRQRYKGDLQQRAI